MSMSPPYNILADNMGRIIIPPDVAKEMKFGEFLYAEADHEYGCIYLFAKPPIRDLGIFRLKLGIFNGVKSRITIPSHIIDWSRAFYLGNTLELIFYPEREYIEIHPRMPEKLRKKFDNIKTKGK
jgi:hypothetical protein